MPPEASKLWKDRGLCKNLLSLEKDYAFSFPSAFLISPNLLALAESRLGYSLALHSEKNSSQTFNLLDSGGIEVICSQKKICKLPIQHMEKEKRKEEVLLSFWEFLKHGSFGFSWRRVEDNNIVSSGIRGENSLKHQVLVHVIYGFHIIVYGSSEGWMGMRPKSP